MRLEREKKSASSILLLRQLCSAVDDPLAIPPLIMVLAHPADEVLGAGSRLPRLDGSTTLIYLTDGAPLDMFDARVAGFDRRSEYVAARRGELASALALAGVAMDQTIHIGLAAREASHHLAALARMLTHYFSRAHPAVVLTHPYEGGHPDNDAAAFAVHAACHMLRAEGRPAPAILEMASFHQGRGGIEVYQFLPSTSVPVETITLNPEARQLKEQMLAFFHTQRRSLRSFPPRIERFRAAPDYSFADPPHPGLLFYEHYPWGMNGPRWRALARSATQELELCMAA